MTHGLKLNVVSFRQSPGTMFSCSYDFVELTDSSGKRIARLSGSMAGFNVTVEGKRTQLLFVKFTSDSALTKQGFLAQYKITISE